MARACSSVRGWAEAAETPANDVAITQKGDVNVAIAESFDVGENRMAGAHLASTRRYDLAA
jgi:hypothetical protein